MASGSLTRGMEVDEDPNEGGTTPFPGEDAVMMLYDEQPSPGVHHVSNPGLAAPSHWIWGCGDAGI
jgi:hypothetical protein